ncbi:Palmitoyltransferase PFA5 [Candida viswanathii]|uniref:Palmitoyltransferase n=1 Tax=Candida viswanathii TaxID=5486 RepID=A0A367YH79_9ASCO|nr:Palmitoyltransferase PFA5 [Candida viswanathii]
MILSKQYISKNFIKLVVPIAIVFGMGYFNFVVNYSLGYKLIYVHHSQAAGIVLWVLTGFLQLALYTYWILIFVIGPGKSPAFPPLNIYNDPNTHDLIALPDLFFCDELGYPYFCSASNSMKIERSFFSKDVGYTVLKFDHYCVWIGHSIGQDNYLFFIKFLVYFWFLFVIALIYLARYTGDSINQGEIDHNFIVLYIFCGFWILMIGGLTGIHIRYICFNITTLDDITRNQRRRYNRWIESQQNPEASSWLNAKKEPRKELGTRYVNVKNGDTRAVVTYYIDERPFDMSVKKNWINLVFNGNRNHGLDELFYTTWKLVCAVFVVLVPFVDVPLCFRNTKPFKEDIEHGQSDSEKLLQIYNTYSSAVNQNFLEMIDRKLNAEDFRVPTYLQKEE